MPDSGTWPEKSRRTVWRPGNLLQAEQKKEKISLPGVRVTYTLKSRKSHQNVVENLLPSAFLNQKHKKHSQRFRKHPHYAVSASKYKKGKSMSDHRFQRKKERHACLFENIYEDNYLKMYHIAIGILKHQMDAENAVHEAFLSIAENLDRYCGLSENQMTGLCITAVKNKCIDILRRQKRFGEEELEQLVLYQTDENLDPEGHMQKKEGAEQIQRVLEQLPEVLKTVLYLKYYYEYDNHEIARQLGISVKTTEMRLYRARKKMRELLDHAGYERF